MYKGFGFAVRSLFRDWKSGELTILALALMIAVAGSTTTNLFADRLNRTMEIQAAAFLGADLAVTNHASLPEQWMVRASKLGLASARTADFASVVMHGEALLLCGVKAVSEDYPLRGNLKTSTGLPGDEIQTKDIPSPGEAWVDRRVLSTLGLDLGDSIEVGERRLLIGRILSYEPDRKGNFSSLSPRVMINEIDVESTGIIQPGSHVHYYFLFSGEANKISEFKDWLKLELVPGQRIMDIYEDRPELGSALSRAQRYLGLTSIVVVIIAGVAIAMASKRYSERHYNFTALLRCLGARQSQIFRFFAIQILSIGFVASALGSGLGWLAQEFLVYLLRGLLPQNLADTELGGFAFSMMMGFAVLIAFSLPPLLRQRLVSPLRVIRNDLDPAPASSWLVYGLAFVVISLLLWRYTEDAKLVVYSFFIGLGAVLLLAGIAFLLLKITHKLLPYISLSWRIGVTNLSRHSTSNISQLLAFSITLTAMVVILLVRTDLLETWEKQLPKNTPNQFALNIFPSEWREFKHHLDARNITPRGFYPIVRGRLIQVNGVHVNELVEKASKAERLINRDFSLTFSEALPRDNKIEQGAWWDKTKTGMVSIEQDLALKLGIEIGDLLTINLGGLEIKSTVFSIRSLRWDTMNPNFYLIFSPGTLDDFPTTYLTSFYLSEQNKFVLNELVKAFPSVTLLDIGLIIEQFNLIVDQVTLAVEYVLLFALMAGCTVLFASVYTSMDRRIYEVGMLRTFGASTKVIRGTQLSEFVGLGLLAGVIAAISAEIILWVMYSKVFDLPFQLNWQVWLLTPLFGTFVITIFGYSCVRNVINQSPLLAISRY